MNDILPRNSDANILTPTNDIPPPPSIDAILLTTLNNNLPPPPSLT